MIKKSKGKFLPEEVRNLEIAQELIFLIII